MKTFVICTILMIVGCWVCTTCRGAEGSVAAVDSNGLCGVVWPMVGDAVYEQRLGVEAGILEAYLAPRYDKDLAARGDLSTDIRAYGIVNAVQAAMATSLLDPGNLPKGDLYGGAFCGAEYQGGSMCAGMCAGGRLKILGEKQWRIETAAEAQKPWTNYDGKNCDLVTMTGFRFVYVF